MADYDIIKMCLTLFIITSAVHLMLTSNDGSEKLIRIVDNAQLVSGALLVLSVVWYGF